MSNKPQQIELPKGMHKEDGFLLACSGGPDSVYLVLSFLASDIPFEVAHCNFGLRGLASDEDEKFVAQLCREHNIPCHIRQFSTEKIAQEKKESIQLTARKLRYQWFEELLAEKELTYLCTGHHLDDRIESFFLNLFRGTGFDGLTPLPVLRGNRFRPLCHLRKTEILTYLETHHIAFRKDASNDSSKYERNKIRLELLPEIEKHFPEYRDRLQDNFDRLEVTRAYLESNKEAFLSRYLKKNTKFWEIDIQCLHSELELLWLLQEFGGQYNHLKELKKLLDAQKGKFMLVKDFVFTREENSLLISSEEVPNMNFSFHVIPFDNAHIEVTYSEKVSKFENRAIYLDASKVKGAIQIRNWREGDRFQPYGMTGNKLVSDFLTDRKISSALRKHVLVACQDDIILGVLGYCCDDRFKIRSSNSNTLIIKLKEN